MREIKCRKCKHIEQIHVNNESNTISSYSRKDTFFCKNCEQLSTIDTTKEKVLCKNCRSTDLTKFFPESKVKCPKCGNKCFDATTGVDY